MVRFASTSLRCTNEQDRVKQLEHSSDWTRSCSFGPVGGTSEHGGPRRAGSDASCPVDASAPHYRTMWRPCRWGVESLQGHPKNAGQVSFLHFIRTIFEVKCPLLDFPEP